LTASVLTASHAAATTPGGVSQAQGTRRNRGAAQATAAAHTTTAKAAPTKLQQLSAPAALILVIVSVIFVSGDVSGEVSTDFSDVEVGVGVGVGVVIAAVIVITNFKGAFPVIVLMVQSLGFRI
jgi:hypothetical protein